MKRYVIVALSIFAAAALVGNSAEVRGAADMPYLERTFSVLRAANQAAIKVSDLADKHAKSDLVKATPARCRAVMPSSTQSSWLVAQKQGIKVVPLDPQTEAGKSLIARLQAEAVMLGSLEGDAFDKVYMTLGNQHPAKHH